MKNTLFNDLRSLLKKYNFKLKDNHGNFLPLDRNNFLNYLLGYFDDSKIRKTLERKDDNDTNYPEIIDKILIGKRTLHNYFGLDYHFFLNASLSMSPFCINEISLQSMSEDEIEDILVSLPVTENNETFHSALNKIYNSYYSDNTKNTASVPMLKKLFKLCITENDFDSRKSFKKKLLGRNSDCQQLSEILDEKHIVLLHGKLGSGRTRFIEHYIQTVQKKKYIITPYKDSLDSVLDTKIEPTLTLREKLNTSSIVDFFLVIDDMDCEPETIIKNLKELARYNVNIVAITQHPAIPDNECYSKFSLSPLSETTLVDIFEQDSNCTLPKEYISPLKTITDESPLLVSLIAYTVKQLYKQQTLSEKQAITQVFGYFINANQKSSTNYFSPIRFKHPIDQKALDIIGHLRQLYNNELKKYVPDTIMTCLIRLSCFGNAYLPRTLLEKILSNFDSDMENIRVLSELGLLNMDENSGIQLHTLVAYSVFGGTHPKEIDYKDIVISISNYFSQYDSYFSTLMPGNALINFASSLNHTLILKHNKNQATASEEFENWQRFLYICFDYYHQMGNYHFADVFLKLIAYPDSQLRYEHHKFDPELLTEVNNLPVIQDPSGLISQIDQILDHLKEKSSLNNLPIISTAYLATQTLNDLIRNYSILDSMPISYSVYPALLNTLKGLNNIYIDLIPDPLIEYFTLSGNMLVPIQDLNFEKLYDFYLNLDSLTITDYKLRASALLNGITTKHIENLSSCEKIRLTILKPTLETCKDLIKETPVLPIHTFFLCLSIFKNLYKFENNKQEKLLSYQDFEELIDRFPLPNKSVIIEHLKSIGILK